MGEALEIIVLLNQLYLTNEFMNWADWLNGFWFDFQSPLHLWHLNAGGPLQLHLARFFRKNSCWKKTKKVIKNDPQNRVFHYFEKKILIFAGNDLKNDTVFYLTVLNPYLGKMLFLSYYSWKGFQPIRLQDSLIMYTSWSKWFFTYRQTAYKKCKKKFS